MSVNVDINVVHFYTSKKLETMMIVVIIMFVFYHYQTEQKVFLGKNQLKLNFMHFERLILSAYSCISTK